MFHFLSSFTTNGGHSLLARRFIQQTQQVSPIAVARHPLRLLAQLFCADIALAESDLFKAI